MIVYYGKGDVLTSPMQSLVCAVNTVGVMGKGIALTMSNTYPGLLESYKRMCYSKELRYGTVTKYCPSNSHKQIILLPTKVHWKNDSTYDLVFASLEALRNNIDSLSITSLSLPLIGCGNGNLDKRIIIPAIYYYLEDISIPVEIIDNE